MDARLARELRKLRTDGFDVLKAVAETVFYRRTILDPPPWPGWPDHLKPWRKWGKR